MKKILSLVLALAMVLMVGAAFADPAATPTLPTANVSITNMVVGDEVSLYKIIKWDTTTSNWAFDGITVASPYETVDKLVTALNSNSPAAAVMAVASAVKTAATAETSPKTAVNTVTLDGTTYTYNAEVGSYLALVKGADGYAYNPMILSVNFTNPTTGAGSTIDANTAVYGTTVVAKKQNVTLTKEVNTAATGYSDVTAPADQKKGVAVGDTIPFIVRTVTPNYGANYTNPVFTITDTLSTGLTMTDAQQTAIVVKNNGSTLSAKENDEDTVYDYTIVPSASGYTITFSAAYLHSVKPNTDVTVEYTATVNAKAVMHNVEQYDNDVNLVYSNSPDTTDNSLHDETHHYTFSIDASLLGGQGGDEVTKELVKIEMDNNGNPIYAWETSDTTTWSSITPLQGATFTLTRSDGEVYNATSDANGYLHFTGLDAATYTLAETSAPAGYKFSTAGIPVVISATYNSDQTLASYTITVDGNKTSTYTATNSGGWTSTTTIDDEADTTGIVNERGVTLPSTGGIGTTIFYIVGGLLVIGAAVILVARRKAHD